MTSKSLVSVGRSKKMLWPVVAFITILVSKFMFIKLFAVNVPFWDQWDGEARDLLIPFAEGRLSFGDLFLQHCEHTMFMTKLLSLILYRVTGKWDQLNIIYAQAVIHASALLWIMICFRQQLKRIPLVVNASILLLFCLPIGYEHMLIGFGVSHLLLLFGTFAICMAAAETTIKNAILTSLGVLFSLLSTAGGISVPMICAIAFLIKAYTQPNKKREIFMAILMVLTIVIARLLTVPFTGHDFLKANSLFAFLKSFIGIAGWPHSPLAGVFFWLPLTILLLQTAFYDFKVILRKQKLLLLIGWIIILVAAAAYTRGRFGNRYADWLLLIVPATAACFWTFTSSQSRWTKIYRSIFSAVVITYATISLLTVIPEIREAHTNRHRMALSLIAALQSEENKRGSGLALLKTKTPNVDLPHPSAETVWAVITHPKFGSKIVLGDGQN